MIRLLAFLAAMLVVWPAMAEPLVSGPSSPKSAFSVNIVFQTGDTADSRAIPVSGFCSVRYQQAGGDDASLYAVTTATAAASSGTLIGAFTASTTTATTFTAGTRWVKAVATDATAGGSVMTIDCAPLSGGGGSGGGVTLVTESTLPGTGNPALIYRITNATDGGDCAAGTPGTEQADCRWNGTAYEPISQGTAGLANVAADPAPALQPLAADLNANGNDITNAATVNATLWPTIGTLQTAINSFGRGSTTDNMGRVVMLPCGTYNLPDSILVGGPTLATMQNGIRFIGCGSGYESSGGDKLAGTTLVWTGTNGGTMMNVSGFGHVFEGILFDGNGEAGHGIRQTGCNQTLCATTGSSVTGKNIYRDIAVEDVLDTTRGGLTGVGFSFGGIDEGTFAARPAAGADFTQYIVTDGSTSDCTAGGGSNRCIFNWESGAWVKFGNPASSDLGQNDQTILENVRFANNRRCLQQIDSQAVSNDVRMIDCTTYTASPGIRIARGGIRFDMGFMGNTINSATGIEVDWCATEVSINGINWESPGQDFTPLGNSNLFGGACSWGNNFQNRFTNNRVLLQATNATNPHNCINWSHHGSLLVSGNTWSSNNADALRKCNVTFTHPGDRNREVTMLGNKSAWNNGLDVTNVALSVSVAGAGKTEILRSEAGRLQFIRATAADGVDSFAVAIDATGGYVDNNNDGDFDAGTDFRLTSLITAVGPYTSGEAYTDGIASTGSNVLTFEGTTVDTSEFTIALGDGDPSADIAWFQPDAFSIISFPTGVRTLATLDGTETFTNKTHTAPFISGSMDMNIGTVNDDDCTGDQGEWWYDTTDSAFEWCPANSGTPSVIGGGSSFFVDAGTAGVPPDGHDIIVGGDEDQTCEANEICLDEGTGEVTAEGFIARPDLDAGGTVTISEGTNDGGQKFILKVPDAGIGIADVTCELNSAGLIPASCVSGGGGLAAGSQIDALRAKPIYYNDFLGGQSAVNMDPSGFLDFSAVASGTSFIVGDQESLNPQDNHPGVIGLLAAAGANSGGAIITGFNGGSKGHFDLDGGEIAEFIFSPKEASGVIIRMGFLDTTDQNDATDGIYLEANGGLAYTCKGANGGTRTTSSTVATLTADAWYRGRITVNSAKTSATCEIWNEAGVSQGSQAVATNLPADNVNTNFGAVATHTAGSASLHLLWLDWAALEFTRSLVR